MRAARVAFVMNVIIVCLVVVSLVLMFAGITKGLLATADIHALKFFTIDSNILLGLTCLIAAIDEGTVIWGGSERVRASTYVLKLMGTTGVSLTMLVTALYLLPLTISSWGPFALYRGSNLFFHLVIPVLAIVVFLGFEKSRAITPLQTLWGVVPVVIYGIFYVVQALAHERDGVIAAGHDWYGFFSLGASSIVWVFPLMLAVTYVIAYALWRLNRR